MKLSLLQPNIKIKLPFQDDFIDVTFRNKTSVVVYLKKLIFHSHQQWLQQNHLHDNETYRAKENQ
jgi:hypothetical protein